MVGSVKNQLQCGSCYAFASAAVLESLYAIKNNRGSVVDLSPQQLADCTGDQCNGGWFSDCMDYLNQAGDQLATWKSYPYDALSQACATNNRLNYMKLGNIQYFDNPQGDETSLAANLVQYGPIFVAIDASSDDFSSYKSGILSIDGCSTTNIDHAITLVGYGYDETLQQSYWIIKNSWGTGWGEEGYVRLAKDAGNMCGVASYATYAKLS